MMSIPADTNCVQVSLSDEQRIAFLIELRDARALVLRDSESFHLAARVLERIGQVASGEIRVGLGKYKHEIVTLAFQSGIGSREKIFRLFETVRTARNDVVHDGAYVRHANEKLVDLLLLLEESMMSDLKTASDVMIRNPTVVEPWHNVGRVRQEMLANSYSFIPVRVTPNDKWKVVSDVAIVKYVGEASKNKKLESLSRTISEAAGDSAHNLQLEEPEYCAPNDYVHEVRKKINQVPILVVEQVKDEQRLHGLITAFDLL